MLYSVVQNIADSKPKVRYLVAVDDSKNTLEEIVKVQISAQSLKHNLLYLQILKCSLIICRLIFYSFS
jgi:hypothetical protein